MRRMRCGAHASDEQVWILRRGVGFELAAPLGLTPTPGEMMREWEGLITDDGLTEALVASCERPGMELDIWDVLLWEGDRWKAWNSGDDSGGGD